MAAARPALDTTRELACTAGALYVFGGALRTPIGRAALAVLRGLAAGDAVGAARAYGRAFRLLAAEAPAGDAWRSHLAEAVARDGNPFTLAVRPGSGLLAAARRDLAILQDLAAPALWEAVRRELAATGPEPVPWADLGGRVPSPMAARLIHAEDWPALAEELAAHARTGGAGPFAPHLAYRWRPAADGRPAGIEPVRHPDLIPLEALIGYPEQRQALIANTERLLAGRPAQDVLLYGDRGTGKSSSVKGLLPRYASQGLRLIALGRRSLADLPRLAERLAGAPQRFVVFVDDLSFEEHETGYKDAKVALQGGVGARPANVVVYATSNRRHLVRERLSERPLPGRDDDPRAGDAVEEKLSLADRFGLTLVFAQPDQELYLRIVEGLAAQRAIELPPAELRARALRWAMWYNGRSGRTARQFVDTLVGDGCAVAGEQGWAAGPPGW